MKSVEAELYEKRVLVMLSWLDERAKALLHRSH